MLSLLRMRLSHGRVRVTAVSAILEMYEIEPGVASIAHIHTELCSLMYKEMKSNLLVAMFVVGL